MDTLTGAAYEINSVHLLLLNYEHYLILDPIRQLHICSIIMSIAGIAGSTSKMDFDRLLSDNNIPCTVLLMINYNLMKIERYRNLGIEESLDHLLRIFKLLQVYRDDRCRERNYCCKLALNYNMMLLRFANTIELDNYEDIKTTQHIYELLNPAPIKEAVVEDTNIKCILCKKDAETKGGLYICVGCDYVWN